MDRTETVEWIVIGYYKKNYNTSQNIFTPNSFRSIVKLMNVDKNIATRKHENIEELWFSEWIDNNWPRHYDPLQSSPSSLWTESLIYEWNKMDRYRNLINRYRLKGISFPGSWSIVNIFEFNQSFVMFQWLNVGEMKLIFFFQMNIKIIWMIKEFSFD